MAIFAAAVASFAVSYIVTMRQMGRLRLPSPWVRRRIHELVKAMLQGEIRQLTTRNVELEIENSGYRMQFLEGQQDLASLKDRLRNSEEELCRAGILATAVGYSLRPKDQRVTAEG
jgi:hypothetical protein